MLAWWIWVIIAFAIASVITVGLLWGLGVFKKKSKTSSGETSGTVENTTIVHHDTYTSVYKMRGAAPDEATDQFGTPVSEPTHQTLNEAIKRWISGGPGESNASHLSRSVPNIPPPFVPTGDNSAIAVHPDRGYAYVNSDDGILHLQLHGKPSIMMPQRHARNIGWQGKWMISELDVGLTAPTSFRAYNVETMTSFQWTHPTKNWILLGINGDTGAFMVSNREREETRLVMSEDEHVMEVICLTAVCVPNSGWVINTLKHGPALWDDSDPFTKNFLYFFLGEDDQLEDGTGVVDDYEKLDGGSLVCLKDGYWAWSQPLNNRVVIIGPDRSLYDMIQHSPQGTSLYFGANLLIRLDGLILGVTAPEHHDNCTAVYWYHRNDETHQFELLSGDIYGDAIHYHLPPQVEVQMDGDHRYFISGGNIVPVIQH